MIEAQPLENMEEPKIDLREEMKHLGIDYEGLNNLDLEIYEKFKEGTLTPGDIRAHQDLLLVMGGPHQWNLLNHIAKNFKK